MVVDAFGLEKETPPGIEVHVYPLTTYVPVFAVSVKDPPTQMLGCMVKVAVKELDIAVKATSSAAKLGSAPEAALLIHLNPIFTFGLLLADAGKETE